MEVVERYSYLGLPITVTEHLDLFKMIEERVASSNRALSSLICKCRDIGPQFILFSKLYNTLVTPVMDYEAEVWGLGHLRGG